MADAVFAGTQSESPSHPLNLVGELAKFCARYSSSLDVLLDQRESLSINMEDLVSQVDGVEDVLVRFLLDE
jgi:hypothetical protein